MENVGVGIGRILDAVRKEIKANSGVFSINGELGCTSLMVHSIHTRDATPVSARQGRFPNSKLDEIFGKKVFKQVKHFIRHIDGAW